MDGTNRIVLITGASSGIGRATADLLANSGFVVYGTSRTPEAIDGAAITWTPVRMDVTQQGSVDDAVTHVLDAEGRIDALINNAGVGLAGAIEETTIEEAELVLKTDLLGVLRLCRAVLPTMRSQGSGRILNVSSLAGRIGLPFQALYSAAKFAVEGATEALRLEVRPFGILVVLVEPGDIHTPFTDHRLFARSSDDSPYAARMRRAIRRAEADERAGPAPVVVARRIRKILETSSPRVRYTVGQPFQRLAGHLKLVLPDRLYERFLAIYYGIR